MFLLLLLNDVEEFGKLFAAHETVRILIQFLKQLSQQHQFLFVQIISQV